MNTTVMPEIRYLASGVEGAEHLRVFRCERLHATITPLACARRYAAQESYPCSTCPIGAMHAAQLGIRVVGDRTRTAFTRPCCRCGRHELRLIGATLCPSCWNRQREWAIGRNGKGGRPTIKLRRYEVLLTAKERPRIRPGAVAPIVHELGPGEFDVEVIALDATEAKRVLKTLWPDAEIIEIGQAAAPPDRSHIIQDPFTRLNRAGA